MVVFATDKDESGIDAAGVAGNRDALEHQVRVKVHQHAVFEGRRLGLVGVDGEVADARVGLVALGVGGEFGEEGPLEAAGEAGAAATPEDGLFDFVGDGVGLHRQGFFEALVAAGIEIFVNVDEVATLRVGVGPAGDSLGEDGALEVWVDLDWRGGGGVGHRRGV